MGKITDSNNFWYIKKNPITKVGVFPYQGKQIDKSLEPDKVYYVLRPKEELFKEETLNSLRLIPLVDNHTMIGEGELTAPEKKGIDGVMGDDVTHDENTIYNDLKIFSNKIKDEISEGKKALSLGYWCKYEKQPGVYNGQRYDFIQRDIRANHLALVNKGRMGEDVRVYDSQDTLSFAMDSLDISEEEIKKQAEYKPIQGENKMAEENKKTVAADEDKRKLIDEIGGILKDKVSEEDWKTIVGKIEKVAYNASEAGKGTDEDDKDKKDKETKKGEDKCGKDEDKKEGKDNDEQKKDDKKTISEDEMFELIAKRDELAKGVEKVVGTFDYSKMSTKQVAKYACDHLDIKAEDGQEISAVQGYLKGIEKQQKTIITMETSAQDSASEDFVDTDFENYMGNAK